MFLQEINMDNFPARKLYGRSAVTEIHPALLYLPELSTSWQVRGLVAPSGSDLDPVLPIPPWRAARK